MAGLLISCVGAYHDSGIGTGGLVLSFKGKSYVVDELDSTGLYYYDGIYYRFIRSLKILVGYDYTGIVSVLFLKEAIDAHDILINQKFIVVVSTSTNEFLFYYKNGKLSHRLKLEGNDDAWHLNCLFEKDDELFYSAFGEFTFHREWSGGCLEKGFVRSIKTGEIVVDGLSGPHTPRFVDGLWVICDSHKHSIVFVNPNERVAIKLGGFTRGMMIDSDCYHVGISADRKNQNSKFGKVISISRHNREIVGTIEIPLPEIYDILNVDTQFCEAFINNPEKFKLDQIGSKLNDHLIQQIKLGESEIIRLNQEIIRIKSLKVNSKKGFLKRIFGK